VTVSLNVDFVVPHAAAVVPPVPTVPPVVVDPPVAVVPPVVGVPPVAVVPPVVGVPPVDGEPLSMEPPLARVPPLLVLPPVPNVPPELGTPPAPAVASTVALPPNGSDPPVAARLSIPYGAVRSRRTSSGIDRGHATARADRAARSQSIENADPPSRAAAIRRRSTAVSAASTGAGSICGIAPQVTIGVRAGVERGAHASAGQRRTFGPRRT
jgi:hypothetical protein